MDYKNKNFLVYRYIDQNLTSEQIGSECKVSGATILWWLKKHNIPRKDPYATNAAYKDKNILEKFYLTENKTCQEIADIFHTTPSVILRYLNKFNIPTRSANKIKGKQPSEKELLGFAKTGLALRGRKFTDQHRKKLSESKSGVNHYNFGKKANIKRNRYWYDCPNGELVSMRSNWEVAYAEHLNNNNIKWVYEPKTFNLSDGSAYTPDFYIACKNQYVEVKGWLTDKAKIIIQKFREDFPEIELILADKAYLKNLGIDLNKKYISFIPKFNCAFCNKEFFRKDRTQILCSIKCRNKYIGICRANPEMVVEKGKRKFKRRYGVI
jgi:hypothetical protein